MSAKCKHCQSPLIPFLLADWTEPDALVLGWVCAKNPNDIKHEVQQ